MIGSYPPDEQHALGPEVACCNLVIELVFSIAHIHCAETGNNNLHLSLENEQAIIW